jgi:hypothetical protein
MLYGVIISLLSFLGIGHQRDPAKLEDVIFLAGFFSIFSSLFCVILLGASGSSVRLGRYLLSFAYSVSFGYMFFPVVLAILKQVPDIRCLVGGITYVVMLEPFRCEMKRKNGSTKASWVTLGVWSIAGFLFSSIYLLSCTVQDR